MLDAVVGRVSEIICELMDYVQDEAEAYPELPI